MLTAAAVSFLARARECAAGRVDELAKTLPRPRRRPRPIKRDAAGHLSLFPLLYHRRRPSTHRRLAPQPGAIRCNWLLRKLRNLLAHRLIPLAPCLSIGNAWRAAFFLAAGSSAAVVGSPWPGHSGELLVQPSTVPSSQCGCISRKLDRGSIRALVAPQRRRAAVPCAAGPPWPWASLLRSLNRPTS
jgi:hypothetical protein